MTPRTLSVLIPVFNEEATIAEVLRRVAEVEIPLEKEVIVADDGSADGTVRAVDRVTLEQQESLDGEPIPP